LAAGPVSAEEDDPKKVFNRVFNKGLDLAKDKHYKEAVNIWLTIVNDIDDSFRPKLHKNLGMAYRKLKAYPEAWYHLTLYLKAATREDTRAGKRLQQVEEKLQETHRRVAISCEPSQATVYLSDSARGVAYPCPLTWWFEPGKHEVHVSAAGHEARTEEIDVRERGEEGARTIALIPLASLAGPSEVNGQEADLASPGGIAKPAEPAQDDMLEWVLVGSGATMVIAGGVFHYLAWSAEGRLHDKYVDGEPDVPAGSSPQAEYDKAYDDEVLPRGIASLVLYGAGAAAAATGAYMLVSDQPKTAAPALLGPLPLPGGGGAVLTLGF